jgi:hypothetical protein
MKAQNTFPSSGNAGINTSSPARNLDIVNTTGEGVRVRAASGESSIAIQNGSGGLYGGVSSTGYPFFGLQDASGNYRAAWITGSVSNADAYFHGNVGIGTMSPLNKFQVRTAADVNAAFADSSGGFGYSGVLFNAYNDAGSAQIPITYNASKHLFFNGNVGIGTASPLQPLDINGNMRLGNALIQGGTFLPLHSASNDAGGIHILRADTNSWGYFYGDNGGVGILNGSGNWAIRATGSVNNANPSIDFFTNNAFRAVIDGGGNLGLGTPSPSSKLQVIGGDITIDGNQKLWLSASKDTGISENPATGVMSFSVPAGTTRGFDFQSGGTSRFFIDGSTGNVTASGSITAKYQDVAEWVPASEQLTAGTVVVLDSTKSNQVTSSSVSYDTRVAGVVSEQPGIALGEQGQGKVLVATTGRVRVKVDATKGPIHIGDLLVTSDVPGMAMKSEPIELAGRKMHMPGTLIGKALEPLEKVKGEILVLLSLQ